MATVLVLGIFSIDALRSHCVGTRCTMENQFDSVLQGLISQQAKKLIATSYSYHQIPIISSLVFNPSHAAGNLSIEFDGWIEVM